MKPYTERRLYTEEQIAIISQDKDEIVLSIMEATDINSRVGIYLSCEEARELANQIHGFLNDIYETKNT
jgi:hypothetical protein